MGILLSITNFIKSLNELIIAISIIISGIVAISGISWYEYGHWFEIWMAIPWYVYLAIIMVIIAAISVSNYRKKFFQKNSRPSIWAESFGGSYELLETVEYESVKWRILVPTGTPYGLHRDHLKRIQDGFKVERIPRCPNCNTELTEELKFLSFRWYCVKCGFSRKSKFSFYISRQNVKKIVRPEIEELVNAEMKK